MSRIVLPTSAELPSEFHAEILGRTPRAGVVSELAAIVRAATAGDGEPPVEDWPTTHAVRLLGDLGTTEALDALLDVTASADRLCDSVFEAIVAVVPRWGHAAIEPVLARARLADGGHLCMLAEILAAVQPHDERVFDFLCNMLGRNVDVAGLLLAEYGDARAVQPLRGALLRYQPNLARVPAESMVLELLDHYESLGGKVDREIADALLDMADTVRERALVTEPAGVDLGADGWMEKLAVVGPPSMEHLVMFEFALRERAIIGRSDELVEFARPLLVRAWPDREAAEAALALADLLWPVVGASAMDRSRLVAALAPRDPEERARFEEIVEEMLERYRQLYPAQHGDSLAN